MEEEVFTISITVSQPAAKIDGTVEIVDDYGLSIVASQHGVELEGVAMSEISQTALIAFGQWYKGDPGRDGDDGRDGTDGFSPVVTVTPTEDGHEVTITDASGDHTFDVNDGVGIPQTLSLVGNELTLSYGGGTVTLPDGLPSQSGQSGKFLTTNGSEAFWDDIPEGAVELSALTDVSLTDLSANQMLKYNAISQKWENVNIPSDAFICTLTVTEVDGVNTYSCDKTIAEIVEANHNDKVVILKCVSDDSDFNIQLLAAESNNVIFFTIFPVFGLHIIIVEGSSDGNTDGWSISTHTFSTVAITGEYNDLLNKPTLGTASALDVAESGNASTTQVVKGDDTRLSDSRNAADVYPWAKANTKPSYTASEVGAIASSEKGSNNGVAELDATGKVPSSQLPSYVDDVLEYASLSAFPATGDSGKIYIAQDTNKTYRWSGSSYAEISESLALGETSSTAYAGNKGKANADAIAAIKDGTSIDSFGDVETALGNKQNTINSSHKLNADYIEDGTTNKVINVKPDWNAASGSTAEILNKPTIPDAVSGTDDGTNWTSLTIGSVTKAIPSGGGSSTLAGLTDVDVSNPSDGQVLTYDNANSEWKNTTQYAAVLRTWTNS